MTANILKPTIVTLILLAMPAAGLLDEVSDALDCDLALQVEFTAHLGTIVARRDKDYSFLADKFVSFETIESTPVYEWVSATERRLVGYEESVEEHNLDIPVAVDVSWDEHRIKWRHSSFTVNLSPLAVFDFLYVDRIIPVQVCDDSRLYDGLEGFLADRGGSDYTSLRELPNGWYTVANSVQARVHLAEADERAALENQDPYDVAYDISDDEGYATYLMLNDAVDEFAPTMKQLQAWWKNYES